MCGPEVSGHISRVCGQYVAVVALVAADSEREGGDGGETVLLVLIIQQQLSTTLAAQLALSQFSALLLSSQRPHAQCTLLATRQ